MSYSCDLHCPVHCYDVTLLFVGCAPPRLLMAMLIWEHTSSRTLLCLMKVCGFRGTMEWESCVRKEETGVVGREGGNGSNGWRMRERE